MSLWKKVQNLKTTKLEYVLSDKNASIKEVKRITGTPDDVVYIKVGVKV